MYPSPLSRHLLLNGLLLLTLKLLLNLTFKAFIYYIYIFD